MGRAMRFGLVPQRWTALVERALHAVRGNVSAEGLLEGVSDATPVGADAAHYGARPRGSFPWGQGPALLALIESRQGPDAGPEVNHG
jgi:unsaturated rhamnogalacturonyl hydrolase